jgi:hypothetical protein
VEQPQWKVKATEQASLHYVRKLPNRINLDTPYGNEISQYISGATMPH